MERVIQYAQSVLGRVCLGLGVAAAVIGCHNACKTGDCGSHAGHGGHGGHAGTVWDIDNCADIEQGAIPLPVGTFTTEYLKRQAGKAEADDFVIYYNSWLEGQAVLGPFGSDQLARIAARLPYVPFPVIIQPEPKFPVLGALRRQAVIDGLTAAGVTDAGQRVFVGRPAAEGLYGEEADRIYPGLVQGGGFGGGNIGFGGGFGGLGFGGGGFGGFAGGFGGGGFGFR